MSSVMDYVTEAVREWPFRSPSTETADSERADGADAAGEKRTVKAASRRLTYSGTARPADVEVIATGLESDDRDVRKAAMDAVATAPAVAVEEVTDALSRLLDALEGDDLIVQIAAARAIARIATVDPEAVVPVVDRLAPSLGAYNLWISQNVSRALARAARYAPETVAPHAFEFVSPGRRSPAERTATRNALEVVQAAATVSPTSVEPIVPTILDHLARPGPTPIAALRTLEAVAGTYPERLSTAIPTLERYVRERSGEPATVALATMAAIALADPYAGRSAVSTLTSHLTVRRADGTLLAEAVVAVLTRYPSERHPVLSVLWAADGAGRLRAARRLTATDSHVAKAVADAAIGESPLSTFLP